jgi:hypothetical protein
MDEQGIDAMVLLNFNDHFVARNALDWRFPFEELGETLTLRTARWNPGFA